MERRTLSHRDALVGTVRAGKTAGPVGEIGEIGSVHDTVHFRLLSWTDPILCPDYRIWRPTHRRLASILGRLAQYPSSAMPITPMPIVAPQAEVFPQTHVVLN